MATIEYLRAKNIRVYKDGEFLGTLTSLDTSATQEIITRQYIGDEQEVSFTGIKTYTGSFNRDMIDEGIMQAIIGRTVSTKFTAVNYEDTPDDVKGTVDNVTNVDVAFTTPVETGLIIQGIAINAKKIGSFIGGLNLEVWEGAAGVGTLKATLNISASELSVHDNEFNSAFLNPESAEVPLLSNTAHTLRFTKNGTPTGSVEIYGPTGDANPYFAINYEANEVGESNYVMDIVLSKQDGTEVAVLRDTGVVFLSNGMTANPGELISESTSWKAKKRTIL